MQPTHLEGMGAWLAALRHEDVPAEALRAARWQVLDMVAAAHAGARSTAARPVAEALGGFAGAGGRATVLAGGPGRGPAEAALANAAHSMAHDFDDVVWMGHTCHSAVFASLAVAEQEGATARDLLGAVVAANEVAGRIGASCLLGPLNGQMWTFVHLAGAAAAGARLLGLDAQRTTHALAIALAQPPFPLQPAFLGPTSKLLAAAAPTATGIQAAYFARAGMTGAPAILEDRRGFWKRFSYLPLEAMLGGLGDFWVMQSLQIKTFPGCHYFQTACSAIRAVLERRGPLRPEEVRAVVIDSTKLGCEATRFAGEYAAAGGPISPVGVNFDLATTAAVMLHAGRLTSAELEPVWLAENAAALRAWRGRIAVRHDPELTARTVASVLRVPAGRAALRAVSLRKAASLIRRYGEDYQSRLVTAADLARAVRALPRGLRAVRQAAWPGGEPSGAVALEFPNRVTLELANGAVETAGADLPEGTFGAPGAPGSGDALAGKFLREVAPSIGEPRARDALAAGLRLGEGALTDFVTLVRC